MTYVALGWVAMMVPAKLLINATVVGRTPLGYAVFGLAAVLAVVGVVIAMSGNIRANNQATLALTSVLLLGLVLYFAYLGSFQTFSYVKGTDTQATGVVTQVTSTTRKQRGDCILSVQFNAGSTIDSQGTAGIGPSKLVFANNPMCATYRSTTNGTVQLTVRKNVFGEFILPLKKPPTPARFNP